MFGPSEPTDSALVNLLVDTGPDKWRRKDALKKLAACETQLAHLASSEPIALLANDANGTHVIAVTSRSVAELSKKRVERYFSFGEIAVTKLFNHPNGMMIQVVTHRARNDYLPDDVRRFEYIIQFFTATPGSANLVCAVIDRNLN